MRLRGQKARGRHPSVEPPSGLTLGFAQTADAVAFFPLTALFEEQHAFKPLENVAFCTRGAGRAQTAML